MQNRSLITFSFNIQRYISQDTCKGRGGGGGVNYVLDTEDRNKKLRKGNTPLGQHFKICKYLNLIGLQSLTDLSKPETRSHRIK